MRMVPVLAAALAAACGGDDTNNPSDTPDAGVDAKPATDAAVVEPSVDGTWLDTYYTTAGTSKLSACSNAPSVVVVDSTTAAVTPYSGSCKADGSFRVMAPNNLGNFYLKVQGALYETAKRADIDLSTDHLGRADVAGITGVSLGFDMTGLDAWAAGDVLMAFSPNIGYYQNLAFSSGGPTNGSTTLSGTATWNGYKIDAAKSDALQVVQLAAHTTGNGLAYVSLDRSFDVPSFTMTNNTTANITGAFTTPTAGSLPLTINVASFNQFSTVVNPNVASRTIAGSAYAAASSDVIPSPSLVSFARDAAGVTQLNFGTLSYSDPFPASWQRVLKVQEAFQVPYTWNNASGSMNGLVMRVLPKDGAPSIIDATLGPPVAPKFDGADAFTATNISPVPMLSWTAPTLGSPTDYEVQTYEVQVSGTSLRFVSVLRLVTKQTSVRIPAGYLLGQRQYVFVIRARSRQGIDPHVTPLRAGAAWSSADALTALVTTDS